MQQYTVESFDGTTIHYAIRKGTSPYVVLVHGLGSNHTAWSFVMKLLPKKYSVLLPDMRGHGRSDRGSFTMENFAKDIDAVLKKEKIVRPVLVGLCLGSAIVAEYCRLFPGKAKKAILLSPSGRNTMWLPRMVSWINKFILWWVKLLEPRRERRFIDYMKSKMHKVPVWKFPLIDFKHNYVKDYFQGIQMCLDYVFPVHKIKTPIIAVRGSNDFFITKNSVQKVFSNYKEIQSSHWVTLHSPELICQIIKEMA